MPSGVSDYGATTWLSALFGVVPLPTLYYIALCSDEPGDAQDGSMLASLEPDDGIGYARVAYPSGASSWALNGAYLTNTLPVAYPTPTDDWGYLNHFALCTDATAGQIFAWGEILNPQYVADTVGMLIPPGALVLGLQSLDNSIVA
jgi:hypothetical protein